MHTVSISQVVGLLEYLQAQGISADTLFANLPLSKQILEDRHNRITVGEWLDTFERAQLLTNDPHLGLNLGKAIKPGSFGLLGYLAMNCPDLRSVLERIPRYTRLVGETGRVEMVDHGEVVEMRWVADMTPYPQQLAIWNLTAWMSFGRWITSQHIEADEVWLVGDPDDMANDLAEFTGGTVHYNKPFAALLLGKDIMKCSVLQADEELRRMLDDQAQRQLRDVNGSLEFTRFVENALLESLKKGEVGLPLLASRLGMSPRSLQRRLRDLGSSYQEVLDETRRNLAMEYIRDARLSLLEISQQLGFAEQSSFNRAFRRWTGDTPSNYRWRR